MTCRICTRCNMEKPESAFRFLHQKGRYLSQCKQCEKDRSREYRQRTQPHIAQGRARAVATVARLMRRYDTLIIADAINVLMEDSNG